jgi:hypothetical protein
MNSRLFDQVEIVFWDTTIPVMTRIRSIQSNLYRTHGQSTITHEAVIQLIWQSFVWSLVGLAFGIFLGFLGFSLI